MDGGRGSGEDFHIQSKDFVAASGESVQSGGPFKDYGVPPPRPIVTRGIGVVHEEASLPVLVRGPVGFVSRIRAEEGRLEFGEHVASAPCAVDGDKRDGPAEVSTEPLAIVSHSLRIRAEEYVNPVDQATIVSHTGAAVADDNVVVVLAGGEGDVAGVGAEYRLGDERAGGA